MKTFDIIHLAALNLYRRLGSSLLTVVGVIIGTTSIIIMIAIGLTNLVQFDEMLERGRYPSENSSMPEIIMGMGVARQFLQDEGDYRNREYQGPSLDWLKTPINMYLGGKDIFDNPDIPSSRQYRAKVVGIIKGMDEENPNYEIYIDLAKGKAILQENYKLVRELSQEANIYDMVYVYADKMDKVKNILSKIQDYGFEAYSDTEWIEEMQKQQRAQQGQLAAIGFISLIVSAIGIANTMMTGLLERRREIGVMKVVGIAIRKIRSIFLVEAAMIGLLGGLAGVLLSHIFAYILSTGTEETVFLGMYFSVGMKIVIPLWLDMAAIGVIIIVGIIAGIFPANKATKASPLEAIRG